MTQQVILEWKIFSANVTQKALRVVDELMSHPDVIVEAVLAGQEFIAIRTIESHKFLFEDLIAVDFLLRL